MWDLVENPEDSFSHNKPHLSIYFLLSAGEILQLYRCSESSPETRQTDPLYITLGGSGRPELLRVRANFAGQYSRKFARPHSPHREFYQYLGTCGGSGGNF